MTKEARSFFEKESVLDRHLAAVNNAYGSSFMMSNDANNLMLAGTLNEEVG